MEMSGKEQQQKEQIEELREIHDEMKKLAWRLAKISNQICSDHLDVAIQDMLETLGVDGPGSARGRVTLEDAIDWQERLVEMSLFGQVN
jgi:hypothetical protein